MSASIQQLTSSDLGLMEGLLSLFGDVFDEPNTYNRRRPDPGYLKGLLDGDQFVALAAIDEGEVVGGLAAYVLHKFEQDRRELYIYDLAVSESHRRQGIATRLIEATRAIAIERDCYVILVQADTGEEDLPAINLYSKLGKREEVLHFDIEVSR